jgi:hypothetical protein
MLRAGLSSGVLSTLGFQRSRGFLDEVTIKLNMTMHNGVLSQSISLRLAIIIRKKKSHPWVLGSSHCVVLFL